jgi:hypothetical protein
MAWWQRLLGGRPSTKPAVASRCLPAAGGRAGGNGDVTAIEQALSQSGFRLHDAGRPFLREYHGLALDVPIAGGNEIKGFVHFAPEMVLRLLGAAELPRLAALMPESACPIGTTGGHTMFVFLDDDGRSYLLDMEWSLFAELAGSPDEMVRILTDGRNGRVDSQILDEQGRPTGEMIREGDERRHWQLDQFPYLAQYMPAASLSPARRPPTWRAMVRAAEDTLAQGSSPSNMMLTCGGFCRSSSAQMYFVTHCENCLYVRAKAGFRILAPPPGIPPEFRVGEVIPFQPPANW